MEATEIKTITAETVYDCLRRHKANSDKIQLLEDFIDHAIAKAKWDEDSVGIKTRRDEVKFRKEENEDLEKYLSGNISINFSQRIGL